MTDEWEARERYIAGIQEHLRRWDPGGVSPGPAEGDGPVNEYDDYAPGIYALLCATGTEEHLARYLATIRIQDLELPAGDDRDEAAARELMQWWSEATDGT